MPGGREDAPDIDPSSHSKQSLARFAEKKEAVQPSSWMDARYPIRSPLH